MIESQKLNFKIINDTLKDEANDCYYEIWEEHNQWNLEILESSGTEWSEITINNLPSLYEALDKVEKHYEKAKNGNGF